MNREQRKRRLQLKPYLDKLEMRRMMSRGGAKPRLAQVVAGREGSRSKPSSPTATSMRSRSALAQHPRLAADLGLGALSQSLRAARGLRRAPRLGSEPGQRADRSPTVRGRPPPDGGHDRLTDRRPPSPATPPTQTTVTTTQSARRLSAAAAHVARGLSRTGHLAARSCKIRSRSPWAARSTSPCPAWAWERPA